MGQWWWTRLRTRFANRRAPSPAPARTRPRGTLLVGTVWLGGDHEPAPGSVLLDVNGGLVRVSDRWDPTDRPVARDLPVIGDERHWIGPAPADVHVHLAHLGDDDAAAMLAGGIAVLRDLGSPLDRLARWRGTDHGPLRVAAAGPLLTAPGGYPSRARGGPGGGVAVHDPADVPLLIARLVAARVDVCKLVLDDGPGTWPTLAPAVVVALVRAAHEAGLPVVAHALTVELVGRALDAGVDEFAHTPTERLPDALIGRIVDAGVGVVSTLQTFFSAGVGAVAAANATALVRAGVPLRYGTDFGNTGTRPGVDPRELDRLAAAGLGRLGALRAATAGAAAAVGVRGYTGRLQVGKPVDLVVLAADPLVEPLTWHSPALVVVGGQVVRDVRAGVARAA